MYASNVNDQRLTFAVSGKLWQRSLVMIDSETKTLWSHILGQAMEGSLKGTQLKTIPSVITDWKSWRRDHPDSSLLNMSRTADEYDVEFYTNLDKWVIGIVEQGKARAWPLDQLMRRPVANDELGGTPLVLIFNPVNVTTHVYRRDVDGQSLRFEMRDGTLFDQETGSYWDAGTGKAQAGPLKGKQLQPVVGILSFLRPWSFFHPDTTFWRRITASPQAGVLRRERIPGVTSETVGFPPPSQTAHSTPSSCRRRTANFRSRSSTSWMRTTCPPCALLSSAAVMKA